MIIDLHVLASAFPFKVLNISLINWTELKGITIQFERQPIQVAHHKCSASKQYIYPAILCISK